MLVYKFNPEFVFEKDGSDTIVYNLENEVVYILNESGAIAFDSLLTFDNLRQSEEFYFKTTKYPVNEQTREDYKEFSEYLLSENIFIPEEVDI